jgi:hypothetical protein
MKKYIHFYLLFFLANFSCSTPKNVTTIPSEKSKTEIEEKNKIIFLFFNITKGKASPSILLEKVTKVDGVLKKLRPGQNHFPNSLTIEIYIEDKLIHTTNIEHPLLKSVEYVNDEKKYEKKQLNLEKESFMVRFQNTSENGTAIIYQTLSGKEKTKIGSVKF